MAIPSLYVACSASMMNKEALSFIFGSYVKVVNVDIYPTYALVSVPDHSEAFYAIHELNGRYINETDLLPMHVFVSQHESRLSPIRSQTQAEELYIEPDLDQYIWRFAVSGVQRFEEVLKFFQTLGTIVRYYYDPSQPDGLVVLKTNLHWTAIVARFDRNELSKRRLKIYFNAVTNIPSIEWHYGDEGSSKGFHLENFFIANASDFSGQKIPALFKPWGEVVIWDPVLRKRYGFLLLKTRYTAEEILRRMKPPILDGQRLIVREASGKPHNCKVKSPCIPVFIPTVFVTTNETHQLQSG